MTTTANDIIKKMFEHYICVQVLLENAVNMMYCSTTECSCDYWRDKRDTFINDSVAIEDMFLAIGVPYYAIHNMWLEYHDNPTEEQTNWCAQKLLATIY